MPSERIVDRAWFSRHPVRVAYELIGTILHLERDGVVVSGRIVEAEAYAGPNDLASHAARLKAGMTFLAAEPGTLYMYRSYGIHTMLNFIAHEPDHRGGILIRALEPVAGIEIMRERRGPDATSLASGPGVLTQAFGFRLDDSGHDVIGSATIRLERDDVVMPVMAGPRIGISKGLSAPYRFFAQGSPHVSSHRRGTPLAPHELDGIILPDDIIIV